MAGARVSTGAVTELYCKERLLGVAGVAVYGQGPGQWFADAISRLFARRLYEAGLTPRVKSEIRRTPGFSRGPWKIPYPLGKFMLNPFV